MSKQKALDLEPCPVCGRDAQWEDVMQPFYHGWVGCKECQRFIKWSGKGKKTAVDAWNIGARRDCNGNRRNETDNPSL